MSVEDFWWDTHNELKKLGLQKKFDKQLEKMRTQISDYELISFFNNLKEIIQAQKELNHVLHKRIGNLEERLSTKEREVIDVV